MGGAREAVGGVTREDAGTFLDSCSAEEVFTEVCLELVGAPSCGRLALDCARLRSCLWGLSGGRRPVHVLRLMNLAVSTAAAAGSDAVNLRENLREALDELEDAGDLISLPGGYWLPAPVREVELGLGDDRLMVGGLPTSILPRGLAEQLSHHGAFRRMTGPRVSSELGLPREALDRWRGSIPLLREWTQQVMGIPLTRFPSSEDARFRVYAPEMAPRGVAQLRRWVDPAKLSGTYFAQRELPFGQRQPRILEIHSGRVVKTAEIDLALVDTRRLQYGLDEQAGNPVRVALDADGRALKVALWSEVPRAERRHFAALGDLETPVDGSYYPRHWSFRNGHEIVRRQLSDLGVRIEEQSAGRAK